MSLESPFSPTRPVYTNNPNNPVADVNNGSKEEEVIAYFLCLTFLVFIFDP